MGVTPVSERGVSFRQGEGGSDISCEVLFPEGLALPLELTDTHYIWVRYPYFPFVGHFDAVDCRIPVSASEGCFSV